MKEQTKKKLTTSKAHFNKVAKDHLKIVAKVTVNRDRNLMKREIDVSAIFVT